MGGTFQNCNATHDYSMFILQLNIYARYPGKTDLLLQPGFEASVVAAEETSAGVEIFASLAIIMPIFVLILIWL